MAAMRGSPSCNHFCIAPKDFTVPPECPIYMPSEEEFKDPYRFINKIRPDAEKYGICKIVPPCNWKPPFAFDIDNFKFKPKAQLLHELEVCTRNKMDFLDEVSKFWALKGMTLKIPALEKETLDLYTLYKLVQEVGGFEKVHLNNKWSEIAAQMNHSRGKSYARLLKPIYERLLYPYELAQQMMSPPEIGYISHMVGNQQATKIKSSTERYTCRSRQAKLEEQDLMDTQEVLEMTGNKELKRLRFYAAGPKMSGFSGKRNVEVTCRGIKKKTVISLSKCICVVCLQSSTEEQMLWCERCSDSYHTFCLLLPPPEIPSGDWKCPKCVSKEMVWPYVSPSLEPKQREFTLATFGAMADQFKSDYFTLPVHMVPPDVVEKEFWRVLSSLNEEVTVEHAILNTLDYGSGFPTKNSKNLHPSDKEYVESPWNLNNLPCLDGSVLRFLGTNKVSKIMVPKVYIGMCFSVFCWHTDDHWSYSVNYLHWGEPRTWYGVAGAKADAFETAIHNAAPELFESQPDLLQQQDIIINPNILMNEGVPVYHTLQKPGEFIVTFPRSFHAGFNQGFSFAEAVNFCPFDWLSVSRESILHHSHLRHQCVFSHDQLICQVATARKISKEMALGAYEDICKMVDSEKELRRSVLDSGVKKAERVAFGLLPDDMRQCKVCKTICFLSAVSCPRTKKMVCLHHFKRMCKYCPRSAHKLCYRYTLKELVAMRESMKLKAGELHHWLSSVKSIINPKGNGQVALFETLQQAVDEAEKWVSCVQQLTPTQDHTREQQSAGGELRCLLTTEELQQFSENLDRFACLIPSGDTIAAVLSSTKSFLDQAHSLLEVPKPSIEDLKICMKAGDSLGITLPECLNVKRVYEAMCWMDNMENFMNGQEPSSIEEWKKEFAKGQALSCPPTQQKTLKKTIFHLEELILQAWEMEIDASITLSTLSDFLEVEDIIKKAKAFPSFFPSLRALRELHKKVKDWLAKIERIQEPPSIVSVNELESLVLEGQDLQICSDVQSQLQPLQEQLHSSVAWLDRARKLFLCSNMCYCLIEVLCPRKNFQDKLAHLKKCPYKEEDGMSQLASILGFSIQVLKVTLLGQEAAKREMFKMWLLREENKHKQQFDEPIECCICQRPEERVMLQCELCRDVFHDVWSSLFQYALIPCLSPIKSLVFAATCVPFSKLLGLRDKSSEDGKAGEGQAFICPLCERSQRPHLQSILSLLMDMKRLTLHLPESVVLESLIERAIN
ncbi:unnamed protein product [Darwinula stevensoni]|uniref:[histone H3]-trimethyl-L-lysine(4) demethylase n=1 Tax=Darwinula stevensoni TaxID=69355 RepID=A0A7R9A6H4_9CRUS|nr:unnamed protein product [Darwinula stevensoni]CAG0894596.1 unnamed protein product [Darwinula stevensoni]